MYIHLEGKCFFKYHQSGFSFYSQQPMNCCEKLQLDRHYACMRAKSLQSCPTLSTPVDCSLPGSSVHRIIQVRIPECVAIPFSRGSSWPRDWTQVSHIAGRFFTNWAIREYEYLLQGYKPKSHWSWPILTQITKFLVPNHQELCITTDSLCVQACGSTETPNLLTSLCG